LLHISASVLRPSAFDARSFHQYITYAYQRALSITQVRSSPLAPSIHFRALRFCTFIDQYRPAARIYVTKVGRGTGRTRACIYLRNIYARGRQYILMALAFADTISFARRAIYRRLAHIAEIFCNVAPYLFIQESINTIIFSHWPDRRRTGRFQLPHQGHYLMRQSYCRIMMRYCATAICHESVASFDMPRCFSISAFEAQASLRSGARRNGTGQLRRLPHIMVIAPLPVPANYRLSFSSRFDFINSPRCASSYQLPD